MTRTAKKTKNAGDRLRENPLPSKDSGDTKQGDLISVIFEGEGAHKRTNSTVTS
jgi:hypothetical protein